MLILPIRFSMITYNPIGVCCWSSLWIGWRNFSVQNIVHSLEQTISKVHIANWVYSLWEIDTSWKLSIRVCPFMFNTFHMPLIDNNNNSLSITFINLLVKVLVSLINENVLKFWEEDIHILDEPINLVWIQALFGKLRCFWILHSWNSFPPFHIPEIMSCIFKSFHYILCEVHSSFVIQPLPSRVIKFWS